MPESREILESVSMIPVVAGLIEDEGHLLIAQRPPGSWMEGLWEFPGGKLEEDEDPREALARELREELGVDVEVGRVEEVIRHDYEDRSVLLLFFWCSVVRGVPVGRLGQSYRWARPDEMLEMEFLPADAPLIQRLLCRRNGETSPK
jgi:8-oxo-dGTP diphosphatase